MRASAFLRVLVLFAACVSLATSARAAVDGVPPASTDGASAAPPARKAQPGLRLFAAIDFDQLAATKSFNAVLGTSHVVAFGGGADITDVWKHLFVRVAVTHASKDGSRVFVDNGEAFSLNIPITISWAPIEAGGGWRFQRGRSGHRTITPYVGGAFVLLDYKETSQFAQSSDNVSSHLGGAEGFGGVEVGLAKHLTASGEAQYRTVPNAIGAGGVSQDFGEKDLGGFTARVLIGYRR